MWIWTCMYSMWACCSTYMAFIHLQNWYFTSEMVYWFDTLSKAWNLCIKIKQVLVFLPYLYKHRCLKSHSNEEHEARHIFACDGKIHSYIDLFPLWLYELFGWQHYDLENNESLTEFLLSMLLLNPHSKVFFTGMSHDKHNQFPKPFNVSSRWVF